MPYQIEWLDAGRRILSIEVTDPLDNTHMRQMREVTLPMIEVPAPLYVLADITKFDVLVAFSGMLLALDGEPLPDLGFHVKHSRLALVGGGVAIQMILNLAAQLGAYGDVIHSFTDRETALKWLEGEIQTVQNN